MKHFNLKFWQIRNVKATGWYFITHAFIFLQNFEAWHTDTIIRKLDIFLEIFSEYNLFEQWTISFILHNNSIYLILMWYCIKIHNSLFHTFYTQTEVIKVIWICHIWGHNTSVFPDRHALFIKWLWYNLFTLSSHV